MPIVDIQQRFRELGRIRAGATQPTGKVFESGPRKGEPKTRPVKLPRFRLTSPWQHLIEQAAAVFGGEPRPWRNDGTNADEFEVFVEVDSLPIVIPPGEVLEQWYELWTGGGCARRCDGVRQVLVDRPCQCPADPIERGEQAGAGKACKPTTRLKVMIPDVADVGIWRLESHGFHAAAELGGAVGLIAAATRSGALIPADLRLAKREGARRPGAPRKEFYVPAISFRGVLGPTLDALGILDAGATMPAILGVERRPALDAGGTPALPPGGSSFDPRPVEAGSLPGPPPVPPAAPPADPPAPPPAPPEPSGFAPPPEPRSSAPEPPEPDAYDPPAPSHDDQGGPTLTGPQIVAMRFGDRGVKDRAHRLALVSHLLERDVTSGNDLRPDEVRFVLTVLDDDDAFAEILADVPPPAPKPPEEPPSAPETASEPIRGELVEDAPRRRRRATAPDPEAMDSDQWRAVLTARKVKVTEVLREAAKLARDRDLEAPANLDAIAGSGLAGLLLGFVEETALAREGGAS